MKINFNNPLIVTAKRKSLTMWKGLVLRVYKLQPTPMTLCVERLSYRVYTGRP